MVERGVLALLRCFVVAGVLAIPARTYAESRLALIVTNAAYPVEIPIKSCRPLGDASVHRGLPLPRALEREPDL